VVAILAIDIIVFSIKDGVVSKLIFTGSTSGAFLVIKSVFARNRFSAKNGTAASRTIFSGIFRLDHSGVNDFVINIG